jgi:hypothetical protein
VRTKVRLLSWSSANDCCSTALSSSHSQKGEKVKQFKDLTKKEKIDLFSSWVEDPRCIQYYSSEHDTWTTIPNPGWMSTTIYRATIAPDYIDWSHVAPDLKFMTRESTGAAWLWRSRPRVFMDYYWALPLTDGHAACSANNFSSYKKGATRWQESLVCRPEN